MKNFILNFFGNKDSKGNFEHSTKKFWYNVTSVVVIIVPIILLLIGKVQSQEFLNYYTIIFPIAGGLYATSKDLSINKVLRKKIWAMGLISQWIAPWKIRGVLGEPGS